LKKLLAAHYYKPTEKINADILLIKPTENYAKLENDYGLSNVSLSDTTAMLYQRLTRFLFSSATVPLRSKLWRAIIALY